jgi:hypothetical protein
MDSTDDHGARDTHLKDKLTSGVRELIAASCEGFVFDAPTEVTLQVNLSDFVALYLTTAGIPVTDAYARGFADEIMKEDMPLTDATMQDALVRFLKKLHGVG